MTTQDKLTYIREKCIAANPEIMELKFGCDVIVEGIREDNPGFENDVVADERPLDDGKIGLGFFGRIPREAIQEVLGRPIRLADVLLAINVEFTKIIEAGYVGIDEYSAGVLIRWNLRADDLNDQSPETIDFLYDLLQ